MGIQGWLVDLNNHSYSTPPCCASCMGPKEVEIVADVSEKSGNIRTTLRMGFPYCRVCAKRAALEKLRKIVVPLLAALIGAGLAVGAWLLPLPIIALVRFGVAIPFAMAIAFVLGLISQQSRPPAPATARGEAIILRDTNGTVLCTNEQFAWHLAQANGRQPRPGSMFMTTEIISPLTAGLIAVLVLLMWAKAGAPDMTSAPSPAPSPSRPAAAYVPPNNPPATPTQPSIPAGKPTVQRPAAARPVAPTPAKTR